MKQKEKDIQKALGLEKGYTAELMVTLPAAVFCRIVIKGFSIEEAKKKFDNLSDDDKRKLIVDACNQMVNGDCMDKESIGEGIVDDILSIADGTSAEVDLTDTDCEVTMNDPKMYGDFSTVGDAIKSIQDDGFNRIEEKDIIVI